MTEDRSGSWRDRHRSLAGQEDAPQEAGLERWDWPFDEPPVAPERWTAEWVGVRLVQAMSVVRRTPGRVGPRAFGNAWPAIVQDFDELVDQERLERAILAKNWRTVEGMLERARAEIADQKARDAREGQRKAARQPPTSIETSLAEDALDRSTGASRC
jgi:hypothetical protein